jgi:hypothetical protein
MLFTYLSFASLLGSGLGLGLELPRPLNPAHLAQTDPARLARLAASAFKAGSVDLKPGATAGEHKVRNFDRSVALQAVAHIAARRGRAVRATKIVSGLAARLRASRGKP